MMKSKSISLTFATSMLALAACSSPTENLPRNPVSGAMAAKAFHQICVERQTPQTSEYVQSGSNWQSLSYDMMFSTAGDCRMTIGTDTPYDQFYQSMRQEIPAGGYRINPIAQGGEGQLPKRNYYLVSEI